MDNVWLCIGLGDKVDAWMKMTPLDMMWLAIGMTGQILFFGRFAVQWYYSERMKQSIIPVSFWYLSIIGSMILLVYSIHRLDAVFIVGYSFGFLVYFRNLVLINRQKIAAHG